jgi:hypothetical protein
MTTYVERHALADEIIDALEGIDVATLRMVGDALNAGGGPLAGFGVGLGYAADARVHGRDPWLARAMFSVQVFRLGLVADEELLERLAGAEQEPWPTLLRAVEQERAASADAA